MGGGGVKVRGLRIRGPNVQHRAGPVGAGTAEIQPFTAPDT